MYNDHQVPVMGQRRLSLSSLTIGIVVFTSILLLSAFLYTLVFHTQQSPGVTLTWFSIAIIVGLVISAFLVGYNARHEGFLHGVVTAGMSVLALVVLFAVAPIGYLGSFSETLGLTPIVTDYRMAPITQQDFENIIWTQVTPYHSLDDKVSEVLELVDIPELTPTYFQSRIDQLSDAVRQGGERLLVNHEEIDTVSQELHDLSETIFADTPEKLNSVDITLAITDKVKYSVAEMNDVIRQLQTMYQTDKEMYQGIAHDMVMQWDHLIDVYKVQRQEADRMNTDHHGLAVAVLVTYLFGFPLAGYAGRYGERGTFA